MTLKKANIHNSISFFFNSESFFLEPYTKYFGRITHFLGNDLVTVLSAASCPELRSWQLILNTKVTKIMNIKKGLADYFNLSFLEISNII